MNRIKKLLTFFLLSLVLYNVHAQQVIYLDKVVNKALLAEEKKTTNHEGVITNISNVNIPSMTAYLPDVNVATGTAVIVMPGGAMRFLSWEDEGINVAKMLNEEGIAAFILKYRLINEPFKMLIDGKLPPMRINLTVDQFDQLKNANTNPSDDPNSVVVLNNAADDAKRALQIIRERASEWNINPDKVGYLGFSAGGGVALGAVTNCTIQKDLPNFIGTIYGPSVLDVVVPEPTPPLFIATVADHRNVAAGCLALFTTWKKAGGEAEIHIYGKGKGAFGTKTLGYTSDNWFENFYSWLKVGGF